MTIAKSVNLHGPGKEHPASFTFSIPLGHSKVFEDKQGKAVTKIETQRNCIITVNTEDGEVSITISAPYANILRLACEDIFKLIANSQKVKRNVKIQNLWEQLSALSPISALFLLHNCSITFILGSKGFIRLQAWDQSNLDYFLANWEKQGLIHGKTRPSVARLSLLSDSRASIDRQNSTRRENSNNETTSHPELPTEKTPAELLDTSNNSVVSEDFEDCNTGDEHWEIVTQKNQTLNEKAEELLNTMSEPKVIEVNACLGRTEPCQTTPIDNPLANLLNISKYPKEMNILLLGETGTGKTTFINGIANYLKYESLDDAQRHGPDVLIESNFDVTDDQFNARTIEVKQQVEKGKSVQGKPNEVFTAGESSTQEPRSYAFEYLQNDEIRKIRIIDTPGVADHRGIEADKENFKNILSYISKFSQIHAICILLKPNSSRANMSFRFCIDELLVHLHKDAEKNIIFCFTNSRGTFYKPGDSLKTLRAHLGKQKNVNIELTRDTMFCFDNEGFRFLCALKAGIQFSEDEMTSLTASWKVAVKETARLFNRICDLPVHHIQDTVCLNNTRNLVLNLSKPLADIVRTILLNQYSLGKRIKEVEALKANGKKLEDELYKNEIVLIVEEIPKPMNVCTSPGCIKHKKIGDGKIIQTIYETVCHEDCELVGVEVEAVPNPVLQKCACMESPSFMGKMLPFFASEVTCSKCKCSWKYHMHIRYKTVIKQIKVIDQEMQKKLHNHGDEVKAKQEFIAELRSEMAQRQEEYRKISQYSAIFAQFLATNSIISFNDSFSDYIDQLINEEKNKSDDIRDNNLLLRLQEYKNEYDEEVKQLKDKKANDNNGNAKSYSVYEINGLTEELRNLKYSGGLVRRVQELDKKRSVESIGHNEITIVAKSWAAVKYGTKYFYKNTLGAAWKFCASKIG